jgi:hypothetical protein
VVVPALGTVVVTAGNVVVVTTGATSIANVIVAVAVPVVAPVAVIVTVAVDALVGVPDTTPVDELNDKPAGRVPVVTAYDTAPVKFAEANVVDAAIAVSAVPDTVCVAGVMAGAATIANVIVAVAVPVVAVAVIVTIALEAAVGVPDTTPVDELNNKPVGNVPLVTAYDTAPVKLDAVNAVDAVITVPLVPAIVWVAGKTSGGRVVLTVRAPVGVFGPSEAATIPEPLLARPIKRS